jgi:CRP-like cAMP-binding protein
LSTLNNPFTQKHNQNKGIAPDTEKLLTRNAAGIGNISKTIAENNIGIVQKGQWLGEEMVLLKLPLLYSATALTDVKLFKVKVSDFQTKFPHEIHALMEPKSI